MDIKALESFRGRQLSEQELAYFNANHVEFDKFMGLTFTEFGPDKITATAEVGPHLLQPAGLVNGGVFASLGETIGSFAGLMASGAPVVGMNNNTDFLRAVKEGTIEAEATPVHLGRRTQIWRIVMSNNGKTCAITTLRTMVLDEQP
ncbi:PaaI family thioesterase [Corynebacterium aquatimens]|uniref:Uncharacterized protein (TIGR00369 family) n=1 Tax=Corynebacterium aquatimens TaxID=1190508 RepID=A0A931DU85_9CORY|nr:PaaI family thioesterase [Corynebacterium aquatimens]MBG6121569.1 uncharacterized protein (TIGR00369 family) [Corynebacterium aquatimens]WJY65891.1 Putative esterase [Corynebacterium aquatimens]